MAKGTIVVSLRSKGIPSFSRQLIFDFRYQAVQFATEFLDLFFSFIVSVACLSWSSWMSVGIIIASIAGTRGTTATSSSDMVIVFFMYIVLPLTIILMFVFGRRDRALRSLSEFKAVFVSLLLSRPAGSTAAQREASDDLYRKAATFIEDVRQYLQHRRPYARHFFLPYRSATPSPTDELLKVSRELGMYLRRVHRGVRDMHLAVGRLRETGVSEALVISLEGKVQALHAATEQLSSIKEMRTPVVLRAAFRWLVLVIIPIAMGPIWNAVGWKHAAKAFAGVTGTLTHLALLAILDTVIAMEDPFDDTALDAISLFEVLDQVGVMTAPSSDVDGYDTEGLGVGRDPSGGGGVGGPGTLELQQSMAHVAMYVSGGGAGDGAGGPVGDTPASPEPPGPQPSQTPSESLGGASSVGPLEQTGPAQRQGLTQPMGVPAMRASIATSETAVGPPSGIDPYGGGASGVGLPSITSPPLPDVGAAVRAPVVPSMPPMPALVGGSQFYRAGAVVH